MGGHLASIHSQVENDLVTNLAGVGNKIWIGQNDRDEEGTWVHTDGTKQTWTNWIAGEPNGQNNENCAEINYDAGPGEWNDGNCDTPRGYVCKAYVDILTTICPSNPVECCARQIPGFECPVCLWPDPYEILYEVYDSA